MHFIGVDPGLMAGVAVLTFGNGVFTMSSSEMTWHSAATYVERWTREPDAIATVKVAAERYTIPTGRSVVTAQQEAIMCNGALNWLTARRGITFVLQPRAEVKKIVTDAVLKKLGWFTKTKDGHANDASRHAGFLLFSIRPDLWLDLTS